MLASPVKRLRPNDWSTMFATPAGLMLPERTVDAEERAISDKGMKGKKRGKGALESKTKQRRADLPLRTVGDKTPHHGTKPKLKPAVELVPSKRRRENVVSQIEPEYYSNSLRAANASRRRPIEKILEAAKSPYPLTPESIKLLAGAVKEAGYKSAYMYIIEAKTQHVEMGCTWSHLLDRHVKLTVSAAKRGMGPRKKAPEIAEDVWSGRPLLPDGSSAKGGVLLPVHLFALGTHWMLREIELAMLTSKDASFDIKVGQ